MLHEAAWIARKLYRLVMKPRTLTLVLKRATVNDDGRLTWSAEVHLSIALLMFGVRMRKQWHTYDILVGIGPVSFRMWVGRDEVPF